MTCSPQCHHTSLHLWLGSLPLSWERKHNVVMRLVPRGCPRNKQWFSQKSRHYSQTLFLLCALQGPPGWESCGCGVKNQISLLWEESMFRKILTDTYYEPSRWGTGNEPVPGWQVQLGLLQEPTTNASEPKSFSIEMCSSQASLVSSYTKCVWHYVCSFLDRLMQ